MRVFKEELFRLQVFLEVDWEGGSYGGLGDIFQSPRKSLE